MSKKTVAVRGYLPFFPTCQRPLFRGIVPLLPSILRPAILHSVEATKLPCLAFPVSYAHFLPFQTGLPTLWMNTMPVPTDRNVFSQLGLPRVVLTPPCPPLHTVLLRPG